MNRIKTPQTEDYQNTLILINDVTKIDQIKNMRNIGLRPHWDGIPDRDKITRNNRIQIFLVTNKFSDKTFNSILSRGTVFIPKSHLHNNLFHNYWVQYHPKFLKKCKDGKKLVKGTISKRNCSDCTASCNDSCPQWMWGFNITDFNKELKLLHKFSITKKFISNDITKWWNRLSIYEKNSLVLNKTPKQFDIVLSNYKGGELMLFMPGLVHWVMRAYSKTNKVFVKAFLETYTHNIEKTDSSGYTISDGGFKKNARNFEFKKYTSNSQVLDNIDLNIEEQDFLNKLSDDELNKVVKELKINGLVAVNLLTSNGNNHLIKDITTYLEQLLEFPENKHILDPKIMKAIVNKGASLKKVNLLDKHIFRHPDGSQFQKNMSSIFPAASGNTGMGAYSKVAKKDGLLYTKLKEFVDPIFVKYYGDNVKLTTIGFGVQGSK